MRAFCFGGLGAKHKIAPPPKRLMMGLRPPDLWSGLVSALPSAATKRHRGRRAGEVSPFKAKYPA